MENQPIVPGNVPQNALVPKRNFSSFSAGLVVGLLVAAAAAIGIIRYMTPVSTTVEVSSAPASPIFPTQTDTATATPDASLRERPAIAYRYIHVSNQFGDNADHLQTADPKAFPSAFVSAQGTVYGVPLAVGMQIDKEVSNDPNGPILIAGIADPVSAGKILVETQQRTIDSGQPNFVITHRFYSFDLKNQTLALLYTAANSYPENHADGEDFFPVAIQGTSVIVGRSTIGTSNICGQNWEGSFNAYFQIDLSDTSAGMVPFAVPQALIDRDTNAENQCSQHLGQ